MSREESVQHFLDLIKKSRRGKFKVYIGMIAGVGKSYRMLQEAHELLDNGVDVKIGYIETHGRAGTDAVLEGLPVVPRRKIFYKGKELEEMDLDAIIQIHPEIVVVGLVCVCITIPDSQIMICTIVHNRSFNPF